MTIPKVPDSFRLAEHVRLIVLPVCSYCEEESPQCECGYPIWKKTR